MKVLFAVFSLCAVATFALRGDRTRYRFTEVDEREVEAFRSGQTYKYRLDTQISSGFASVSDQHAVTRLQAEALIHFQSDRLVTLKLNDVLVGTLNQEIQEPERVQPWGMFKETPIKSEESRQLELPCTFDYVDGLVERVRFHQDDKSWSKNIKKAVLNMLQMNLKQRQGENSKLEQLPEWKQERELEGSLLKSQPETKMFVMPEITLEGECQVSYTLNKMNPTNKFNSYNDNNRDEVKMFNVTKSVNFRQCSKIADIQYGPKLEKSCNNCTAKKLEEKKLDRTTILRQVVVGTPEKYAIKKVELVSHYIYKMLNVEEEAPMHIIVAGQLNYIRVEESRRELERVSTSDKAESLLYSIEWDDKEKRFYMYGDEEFPQNSPFEKVQDKVTKIENLMKQLVSMWSDKVVGIESEATFIYSRIVELVRMCNQEEIKEILSRFSTGSSRTTETGQLQAEDILIDALSNAGTYNTIKGLVEKILRKEITPARAVRALIQLKDLPAPSEKQVKILTDLCQNEVCKRHEPCHQICWLTTGSIMAKICSEDLTSQDAVEQKKSQCHLAMKKEFVSKIMAEYGKVETRYAKILLLKTLGNAGLEPSVYELEKIIRDIREEPIVRMQAIDSLRRLRPVMPQKIQRVLMPIFQNVRERPEIRMMALSQILATIPEKPILDQIGLTLIRDPSRQVRSYVYGAMQQLAESPIQMEKELARHLKSLNKLANINEEEEEVLLRGSRFYRIPVYSQAKKEGFFVELESMVGAENVLPKHLSASLDTYFNGLFQKNGLEVSFTQEDLEQWAEKLMNVYMDYYHGESSKKSLRGSRSSQRDSSEADKDFRSIVQGLGIKRRSSRVDSDSGSNNSPYGMLCFRYGDIDYAVLPLEEELLTPALKKILIQGERPSARDFEYLVDIVQGRPFRAQAAMHLLETTVKIPTSMGLPVRMWHVIPVLASIEGQIKPQLSGSELNVEVKLHPTISITHLKRIEIWTPIVNTGVETSRTASLNLPLTATIKVRDDVKVSIDVPQHKFRAITFNSLPVTYTREQDWKQQRTPNIKRVENQNLIQRAQRVEKVYGKQNFGMPLKINGEFHVPQELTYGGIVNALMTSENHLQVVFEPTEDTPREIRVTAQGESYGQSERSSSNHRQLKDFYSKSKFDTEMDQDFEEDQDSERRFSSFVDKFEPRKMYNHKMSVKIQTVGGRQEKEAQMELNGATDSEHRYVKAQLKVKRSPLPSLDESSEWSMKSELQAFLPETHTTIQQYNQQRGQKQQKLVCKVESEWGTDRKQKINLNINGEEARRQGERRESSQRMLQKVAFLNKYDISAEFSQITQETKNFFNNMATLLKSLSFWNTKVELKSDSRRDTLRDGQITATIIIDSMTHEHVNVTLKTPVEIVRIDSMSLPMKVQPFKLVKSSQTQKSSESFTELVHSYASESRPECKVDSRKVRSFDDAVFKAPLTKCYSVLAKDCSSETPRFAVLMKKINGEEKAMKILSNEDKIEIQPESGKLIVKINGRREEDEDKLREAGIEYTQDLVRFNSRDVSVRFDGEQASIKISPFYKNQQCGLCGHYNDNTDDDFRMGNNEMTSDLKSYHRSYSMVDDECRDDLEKTHREEEYEPLKMHHKKSRDFSDEEPEQHRRRTNKNGKTELAEKTEVMEYNHKICFSLKPVKTCPENTNAEETKDVKVSFTCLDRSSSEARRLLREARRSEGPVEIRKDHKISFVETIAVPTTCAEY